MKTIHIPDPIKFCDAEQHLMQVEADVDAAKKLAQIGYSAAPWTRTGYEEDLIENMAFALNTLSARLETMRNLFFSINITESLPVGGVPLDNEGLAVYRTPSSEKNVADLNKRIEEYKTWTTP